MWKTYYVMRPNFDGKQVRSEIGKYDPLFIYIKNHIPSIMITPNNFNL